MYAAEKFWKAARSLAVGAEPIKERLRDAYTYNVSHLEPEQVPAGKPREQFVFLRTAMTTAVRIDETVEAMSEEQAQKLAGMVVDLAFGLHRAEVYQSEEFRLRQAAQVAAPPEPLPEREYSADELEALAAEALEQARKLRAQSENG